MRVNNLNYHIIHKILKTGGNTDIAVIIPVVLFFQHQECMVVMPESADNPESFYLFPDWDRSFTVS